VKVTASINLHYDLHVPDNSPGDAPLLIAVHGYAAHMDYMMREGKLIAPRDFVIASLQGPNRFWREASNGDYKLAFGWLNDFEPAEQVALHHDFILKIIDELSQKGVVDRERVFLYGFSQSCALNFRFAFTHPEALKGIIGVCGGIPSDLDSNETYEPSNADVLYVYGDDDVFYPAEKFEAFDKRLREYLPKYDSKEYKAKHEITNEMRRDIKDWLKFRFGNTSSTAEQ
jgi:phospholipase/carboxylesterase